MGIYEDIWTICSIAEEHAGHLDSIDRVKEWIESVSHILPHTSSRRR